MKVIYILSNNRNPVLLFQFSKNPMGMIRLHLGKLLSPIVIEVQTPLSIIIECFMTRQIFPIFIIPHSILTTERTQSTLCTDTCSC